MRLVIETPLSCHEMRQSTTIRIFPPNFFWDVISWYHTCFVLSKSKKSWLLGKSINKTGMVSVCTKLAIYNEEISVKFLWILNEISERYLFVVCLAVKISFEMSEPFSQTFRIQIIWRFFTDFLSLYDVISCQQAVKMTYRCQTDTSPWWIVWIWCRISGSL